MLGYIRLIAAAKFGMKPLDGSARSFSPGRYEKIAKLGEGTYGVVYRARDRVRECFVALKKACQRRGTARRACAYVVERRYLRALLPRRSRLARRLSFRRTSSALHLIYAALQVRMDAWEEGVPATALREISALKEMNHPNIVQVRRSSLSRSADARSASLLEVLAFSAALLLSMRRTTHSRSLLRTPLLFLEKALRRLCLLLGQPLPRL